MLQQQSKDVQQKSDLQMAQLQSTLVTIDKAIENVEGLLRTPDNGNSDNNNAKPPETAFGMNATEFQSFHASTLVSV